MTQDEKWMVRYEEVVNFIEANHRAAKLKEDRVGRFNELLALIEENKRVNQYD